MAAPKISDPWSIEKLVSFALGTSAAEQTSMLPDFPMGSLKYVVKVMENNPHLPVWEAIHRLYPYTTLLPKENRINIENLLKSLDINVPKYNQGQEILEVNFASQGNQDELNLNKKGTWFCITS